MFGIRSAPPRSPRRVHRGALAAALGLLLAVVLPAGAEAAASGMSVPAPLIVPKPVSMTVGHGRFTLSDDTRIVVERGGQAALPVARDLAAYLRPATGFRLPVVGGHPHDGDVALAIADRDETGAALTGEAYRLQTASGGVLLESGTAHGLYDGVQTIRQLLPPWIESPAVRPGPWTMPAVRISDWPRYSYRGVMLDIARHFEPPSAVERLLGQVAAYKIDVFHLHLADDQGFRIVTDGFPNLTAIGGQGSVGTGGRTVDPGGFWTQAEYREVVAFAAARFIQVMPEVDTPGHDNAIIMSEFGDTTNPLLNGHPQDINCGRNNPPVWNYTGDVGYSALCPESPNTWPILTAIISQLSAMSSSPWYDLGGDEVPHSLLSQTRYAALVNREAGIVQAQGRAVFGWADIAGPGTTLTAPSVAEYWQPASGSSPDTITATEAVQKGMKLVMAPADRTYLDQVYFENASGPIPRTIGLDWACPSGCDVDAAYNWDPGSLVNGVTDKNVIGVEGAMWAETVVDLSNIDYMVFPRLPAYAEVGWSPVAARTGATSPAYLDFLSRLAAQGPRLLARGVNFYPSPEVPWRLDATGSRLQAGHHGHVQGTVATLSAPGIAAAGVTATIDWGDGATNPGTVSGSAATDTTVNGLFSIAGAHTYRHPGRHVGTVTMSAPSQAPVTVHFTVDGEG